MDKEFNLVMITEHFMESLVLLRRTMCWGIGDILFASINKRLYLQKGEPFHPKLIKMHRKWNLGKDIWLLRNWNEKMKSQTSWVSLSGVSLFIMRARHVNWENSWGPSVAVSPRITMTTRHVLQRLPPIDFPTNRSLQKEIWKEVFLFIYMYFAFLFPPFPFFPKF